jgi:hypothetical protein
MRRLDRRRQRPNCADRPGPSRLSHYSAVSMRMSRWQILGILVVTIVGAGYSSAVLGRATCEDRVARDIAHWAGRSDVHVLRESAVVSSRILARAQLKVSVCDPVGPRSACAPLARVDSGRVVVPYLVSVQWLFNGSGLGIGGSGSRPTVSLIDGSIRGETHTTKVGISDPKGRLRGRGDRPTGSGPIAQARNRAGGSAAFRARAP